MTCYQSNSMPLEEWKADQISSGWKRAVHGQKDRPLRCDQQPIADRWSSKIYVKFVLKIFKRDRATWNQSTQYKASNPMIFEDKQGKIHKITPRPKPILSIF